MLFNDTDEKMHGLLCRNTYSLRELLNVDVLKKDYEQANLREYYVASIIDENIKFLLSVIRWNDDFKDGFDKDKENTVIGNLIIQGLSDEINMYHRKLLESLINVILWSRIQDDNYLKYYYLIKERNKAKNNLSDLREFYGISPQGAITDLQNLEHEIVSMYPKIDESKCFFLDLSRRGNQMADITVRSSESSLKTRLKSALKTTDDIGKVLIGFTYDSYASASKKIHFSAQLDTQHSEIIMDTIRFIFVIVSKLTVICAQWLDIGDLEEFKRTEQILAKFSSYQAWYTPLLEDIYDLDDYVYTPDGKLGRIIDKGISQYDYRTYKIHFLDNNGMASAEDYFPAQAFKRIKPKQDLYNSIFKAQPDFKKCMIYRRMKKS